MITEQEFIVRVIIKNIKSVENQEMHSDYVEKVLIPQLKKHWIPMLKRQGIIK